MVCMNPTLYITLSSAIINFLVGFYVYFSNPKKISNRIFTALVILSGFFAISEFFVRSSDTRELALLYSRIGYSIFPIVSCVVVHFASIFPRIYQNEKNIFAKYKYSIIYLYTISIIMVIIFNLLVSIQDVHRTEWGFRVLLSRSTAILIFFFLFCGFITLYFLLSKYYNENISGIEKNQIKFVLLGLLLIFILSLGTNLVPPIFNLSIFPMTSISLLLFSVLVAYSILKYETLKLTPVETANVIMDTLADPLVVVDKEENIINVNKSTFNHLGYNKKELINFPLRKIINIPNGEKKHVKKVFESKSFEGLYTDKILEDIEIEFVNKSGKNIPMSVSASTIYNSRRNIEGVVLIARDLTEVKKSLKEKEMLLREIHHRVKNNLQLISSLLDLQSEQTQNKDIIEMFRESQNRIKLMAALHEQLYRSKNLKKINLYEHFQSFVNNLFSSYIINPDKISLKITTHNICLDFKTTLLCSMIVSELVSNSLKYAFPADEKGEIIIDFNLKDDLYILIVSDNGVGLPEKIDFRNTKTLGLQLVNMFVQQLKGSIQLDRSNGTKFIITFGDIAREKRGQKSGK